MFAGMLRILAVFFGVGVRNGRKEGRKKRKSIADDVVDRAVDWIIL